MVADLAKDINARERIPGPCQDLLHLPGTQIGPIDCPLAVSQRAEQHLLGLPRQLKRHVLLPPPQQVGKNQVAEHHAALVRGGDLKLCCIRVPPGLDGQGKMRLKDRQRPQLSWEDKVEQGPELLQPILYRRPGEDEPIDCPDLPGRSGLPV